MIVYFLFIYLLYQSITRIIKQKISFILTLFEEIKSLFSLRSFKLLKKDKYLWELWLNLYERVNFLNNVIQWLFNEIIDSSLLLSIEKS